MPFTIVAENCTGCTACEKRCPTRAISGELKKAFLIEPGLCIDCGACGVICPDEAILDTYGNVTKVLAPGVPDRDRPPRQHARRGGAGALGAARVALAARLPRRGRGGGS